LGKRASTKAVLQNTILRRDERRNFSGERELKYAKDHGNNKPSYAPTIAVKVRFQVLVLAKVQIEILE
jgi:hypothetical protein